MLVRILDFVPFILMHFILILVTPKKNRKSIVDIYFYSVILGLIGARLFYVLLNLEVFSGKLLSIIYPSSFNLSLIGGIVVSLSISLILGLKKDFDLRLILRKYFFTYYSIFFMLSIVSYVKRVMYPLHIISGSVINIILSLCLYGVGIASEYVIPKENKIMPSVLFLVILFITQIVL